MALFFTLYFKLKNFLKNKLKVVRSVSLFFTFI